MATIGVAAEPGPLSTVCGGTGRGKDIDVDRRLGRPNLASVRPLFEVLLDRSCLQLEEVQQQPILNHAL